MRGLSHRVFAMLACLLVAPLVRGEERPAAAQEISRAVGLETTRQEMIESRLDELLFRFQQLSADLASNPGVNADSGKETVELENRLAAIKTTRLAQARTALAHALQNPSTASANLQVARTAIDRAARELASLLLHAGLSPAAEVFAREIGDLIDQEQPLQAKTLQAQSSLPADPNAPSGAGQKLLADRLDQLLVEVAVLPASQTDALAGVRINRARNIIESAGTSKTMKAVAESLDGKSYADAASGQAGVLSTLREAEIKLRSDARLQELIRTRNMLQEMLAGQKTLRTQITGLDDGQWQGQRRVGERRQHALVQPLLQIDAAFGLEEQIRAAMKAAGEAGARFGSGDRPGAISAEGQIEAALTEAIARLQRRIDDSQSVSAAYRRLQDATARLKTLQDISDRHDKITDNALDLLQAKKELGGIADVEQHLADAIGRFSGGLAAGNKWTPVLRRPLKIAEHSAEVAADAMKNRKTDKLKQHLADTGAALTDAVDVEKKEADYLDKMWSLKQLSGDLKEIAGSLGDIKDEQADLRAQFQTPDSTARSQELASRQEMAAKALEETSQLVGPILEAAPMKPQLDEAGKAMNDAGARLRDNKPDAAVPLALKAGQSLEKAGKFADDLAKKADYMVEMAEALEKMTSDAVDLLQRQIVLRQKTEVAEPAEFDDIAGEQDVLKGESGVMAETTVADAAKAYHTAVSEMDLAMGQLKSRQRDLAVEHQIKAENALRTGLEELQKVLAAMMEAIKTPVEIEVATNLDPLSALLFLAIQEKELCDVTHLARESNLPGLAPKQMELKKAAEELTAIETLAAAVDDIRNAMGEMDKVVPPLQKPDRQAAIGHERAAEKFLRMAFARIAITLYLPPKPAEETTDSTMVMDPNDIPFNSMEHWSTFMKGGAGGAEVKRDKAQWESLTERQRGALNENFARELPLEYRRILKEYYEALSK